MAWLGTWAKRYKIIIDNTKISGTENLTDFPITIKLGSAVGINNADVSDIFDDLGANSLKLAVTTDDGTTQCYVEVSFWDNANNNAVLYVKIPTISYNADTVLYFYYDVSQSDNSSYVGVTGSTAGKQAWDNYYFQVFHFMETPAGTNTIKDSSKFSLHATNYNTPELTTGMIDKALDFESGDTDAVTLRNTDVISDSSPDGKTITNSAVVWYPDVQKWNPGDGAYYYNGSSAYFELADHSDWQLGGGSGDFTIDMWLMATGLASNYYSNGILTQYVDNNNKWGIHLYNNAGTRELTFGVYSANSSPKISLVANWAISTSTWYHLALVRSGNDFKFFIDGQQLGSTLTDSDSIPDLAAVMRIGWWYSGSSNQRWQGYIENFRISDVARWTSNFSVPTGPTQSDSNTLLLINATRTHASLKSLKSVTHEAVFKLESHVPNGGIMAIASDATSTSGYKNIFGLYGAATNASRLRHYYYDATNAFNIQDTVLVLALDTWYHTASTFNSDTEIMRLFRDGTEPVAYNSSTKTTFGSSFSTSHTIGTLNYTGYKFDGIIDELRISSIDRSPAWILATKHTLWDNLLYFSEAPNSWITGWNKRKSFTVSHASGEVYDHQMLIKVGESSGATGEDVDCGGLCKSDFSDLRFGKLVDGNATLLSYWIESITGTTPNQVANVWVKFDYIDTVDTTFYMYYNNPNATAGSNGDNTFPFFDDFNDSSLDTNKWTNLNGSVEGAGSVVVTATGLSSFGIIGKTGFEANHIYRARVKPKHYNNTSYLESCGFSDNTTQIIGQTKTYFCHVTAANSAKHINLNNGSLVASAITGGASADVYTISEIIRNSSTNVIYKLDDANQVTIGTYVPTVILYPSLTAYSNGSIIEADWILVRKYLSTEPTFGTWGEEEDAPAGDRPAGTYGDFLGRAWPARVIYSEPTNYSREVQNDNDNGWIWALGTVRHDNLAIMIEPSGRLKDEAYIRYTNVTIPQGSLITAAYIAVTPTGGTSFPSDNRIYQENITNAGQIASVADFDSRTWTTSYVSWYVAGGGRQNTPSFVSLVQQIVNLPGWASGNAMQFKISPEPGQSTSKNLYLYDYSQGIGWAPTLYITYQSVGSRLYYFLNRSLPTGNSTQYNDFFGKDWPDGP